MTMSRRPLVAIVAVTATLAAGATGVALADDSAPRPFDASTAENGDEGRPDLRRGERRSGHRAGGLLGGRALHGEVVVPDPDADGRYRTMLLQRGEATAVSPTEITVRSEDGFTATYTVSDDTVVLAARDGIEAVAEGTQVAVVAVEQGDGAEAVRVVDRSARRELRKRFGLDGPRRRA